MRVPFCKIFLAAVLSAQPICHAGELNILGNVGVVSNLNVNTLTLGGQTRSNWPSSGSTGIVLTNGVVDPALGTYFAITLTTNVAWDFQGHAAGRTITLKVAQDSVGGWTNDWGTNVLWAGGVKWPALTAQAERWDLLRFVDDGERWLGIVDGKGYRVPCQTNCSFALAFDGQNYAAVPADSAFDLTNYTFEAWVRTSEASGEKWYLIGNDSQYPGRPAFGVIASWGNIAYFDNGVIAVHGTTTGLDDGEWHHVAVTYDGTAVKIWVDGVLEGTTTTASGAITGSNGLFFGKHQSGWDGSYFPGAVDEVRISSIVRYTTGFTPATSFTSDSDTVAYWRFNEGDGSTATDETSNHNGTLEGSPVPTWVEGR